MRTFTLLPLLVLSLLLTPGVSAAKQKQRPPPQEQLLTLTEQWCQYFGRIVGALALDRDTLVPLTVEVGRLRTIMRNIYRQYPTLPHEQRLTEEMVQMAYLLYATPAISALQARHAFEIGCLNPQVTERKHNALLR